jgi:serine phosphatase RsbU (regulator of sigma subunit)
MLFTVVPAIDFVAIALLRSATGGAASVFTALVVLPVFWVAGSEGRRSVVYAVVGSLVVILAPLALDPGSSISSAEVLRLAVYIIVFGTVAGAVNVLTARARLRVRNAQANEGLVVEEIDRAAAVQRSLLPDSNLTIGDDISVAGTCLPAKTVGGDFFDWYDTGDGVAITIGDVMGKGVGAGLIAAAVRASVRSAHAVDDPAEALLRASDGLEVATTATEVTFTTLFHARLSTDGLLRWADAGHGLSAIVRPDGSVEHLSSQNLPLGLQIGEHWQTNTTRLDPGDVLVSVSDGVLDLFDGVDEAIEGMNSIARENSEPATIVARLSALAERVPHDDDVTVVAVRREPRPEQQPAAS